MGIWLGYCCPIHGFGSIFPIWEIHTKYQKFPVVLTCSFEQPFNQIQKGCWCASSKNHIFLVSSVGEPFSESMAQSNLSLTRYPNGCASELYWEKSTLDIKTCHFMELLYNLGQWVYPSSEFIQEVDTMQICDMMSRKKCCSTYEIKVYLTE